jgi:glutamate-1-semialdehyde aminotransferase
MLEQMQQKYDRQNEQFEEMKKQMEQQADKYTRHLNMSDAAHGFEIQWRENELHNPAYCKARVAAEEELKQMDCEAIKQMKREEKAVEMMFSGEDGPGEHPLYE